MASLTNERIQELVVLYDKLKKRILLIDEKYSLEFVEPELDMPESLGLEKLKYTPKTEEELMALAEEQVAPTIISKQATIEKNYNTKVLSLASKIAAEQQSLIQKTTAAKDTYNSELVDIHNRLVNNGLIFSTIATKYETQAKDNYNEKVNKLNEDSRMKVELIGQEQKNAEELYNKSVADLEEEKAARILAIYQKLLEQEEALKRSIDKYNTGLDEKEARYQASRAKAYENARRAAYTRAYNNSKLYMEIGETGYRRTIEKEKYVVSKDAFYTLRRNEAQAILSMDSFLEAHLGTFYSSFVDWVNTTLLP